MSLSKEHSRDKTDWVKWPHLETHWQPQHYETPHRALKKADNSRSHSWWWDSHISPKSSKWLQENLAEMDSKVNAMLKIIEEDADSFAKRAEMYYKRRPELVSLVEEFYRTYRALVERHTHLTKELRQNIAPALQAHLTGAAYESPLNLSGDPLVKDGSGGFDIASLSSYSFPGVLDFGDDSQSEFSAKSPKGHMDEEDASPRNSRASFETREFEFQPFALSSEEEHHRLQYQNRKLDGFEELRKTVQILEDEKKALTAKSGEDDVKLKDLQSEVSSLLSKTKALEAEEKLAKDRLNELLQLKQTLEAENLKLSHALITSKEEKTQLIEVRDRGLQEMLASGKRIHELEEDITLLQQKTAASHAEALLGQEQVKRFKEECEKLQHSLAVAQEGNQREAMALKDTFEKRLEGLQKQIIDLEEENGGLKEQSATRSAVVERLCADVEELKNAKDHSFAKCQQSEEECKALKAAEEELKALLAAKLAEGLSLQNDKSALEGELAKVCLQMEELQTNMSALSSEKAALRLELGEALEQIRITNTKCLQWQAKAEECQAEIQMLRNESAAKVELISKLENEVNSQSMGITKLEEKIVLLGNEKENDIRTMAEYEGKVHDLESKVSESLAAQTALNEQVAQKSLGVKSLEVELVGVCKEKDVLSEKFAVCSAHAMLLQNQLDKCKELEDVQHADLQKRADMIQSMEMEVESLQLSVSKAAERNNALICEQQKSLDEIRCMSRRIKDLDEQVSHLTEDKVVLVKDHEEQKGRLQMQLQSSNDMTQSLEAELLKLHKAVSTTEESNSIPVCQQSRSFDAGLIMPDRITHIHHKVGSLLEERALLVSKVSYHKEQRDEMELRLHCLERDKGAVQEELKEEQQAVFEARRNVEKLEGDLSQLRQVNTMVENELSTKAMELSSAREDASKAITRNNLLEDEARQHLHQIKILNEDVERLQHQLQDAQQEMKGLEEHLSLSAIKCSDAEKATCEAKEEISEHVANGDSLRHQMAVLLTDVSKLEQDVASVQEEKKVLFCKMEVLQLEVESAQREKQNLMLQMKDRISELEEKEVEMKNLQEQLKAAESDQISSIENLSGAKNQWAAEQEKLQQELAQFKATSLEGQKNLVVQLESVNKLKTELLYMQQEDRRLEEHSSQVVSKHMDAERATLETKEELNKQITNRDLLNSEMAVVLSNVRKLKHDLAGVQDEKKSLFGNLESMQVEMTGVRGENEHLMSQVKAVMLQLQGKDSEIEKLKKQLQAAESHSSSLAEALSSMKISWGVEQEMLQGELAQLKATNIEGQKDLAIQLDCVSKLKDELSGLHGERSLLQEDRDLGAKQLAVQLNQIEDARKREHQKDAELLELTTSAETLKQSLLARDFENSKLREDLSKSAECQSESEKRFMDEISYLQSEEMKWRNEVTTNSALMAEKVASLRMENAALHENLSLKLELLLKLQKDVESLTEERSSLSQALQAMAAEMQEYKNDLQFFKEEVIPSLEERVGELQQEIIDLTLSNERHVAEIVSLREQLKHATGELLCLHDENAILKIERMFNVEMLKHLDGVFSTIKAENLKLFDKLGLQEKHSQMQEQILVKASGENEDLTRRLLTITEERNGLKTEVQSLIAMLVEVERLQRELAAGRQDNGSVRGAESSSIQTAVSSLSNSDRGSMVANDSINNQMHDAQPIQNIPINAEESVKAQMCQTEPRMLDLEHGKNTLESQRQMEGSPLAGLQDVGNLGAAKEGSDGKLKAFASSHALLIARLKGEILYLQEEIQRLQLATAGQGSGFASNEVGARDFLSVAPEDLPSPRKNSTASSSSILTIDEAQERLDDVQKLKEENCNLVEEIDSLKSQSLAALMENNLIENSVRDLQAKLALLQEQNGDLCSEVSSCKEDIGRLEGECHSFQEKNGHLGLEVSSCKADIERLGRECHSLQEKNAELQQDLKASTEEKRKSEETRYMLEDVITSLERNNRRLQAENESASMEMKKLHGAVSCLHDDGSELVALIKTKMMTVLEEVKLVLGECRKEIGDEGIVQIMDIEHLCMSPHGHVSASLPEDKQGKVIESTDQRKVQEAMTELEARNMLILTELQARAEETNILLEFVLFIRKLLLRFLGGEHTCQRDAPRSPTDGNLEGDGAGNFAEGTTSIYDEHHIKLAERLHRAFMDERLDHELLELKEGRKGLKEELEVRLAEVQRMEWELEKFQVLLEQEERGKGERVEREEEKRRKNMRAEESAKELREMLAQQRRQIGRMQEEVMFGEEQQEAAAENQVTVLVSMERVPSMEGWDDEQVNLLSRELENLRGLNRRHSSELQTISQDLQSMGSIIKAAQDQLLLGSPQGGEEEIISMADFRTQNSSIIDLRTQDNRVSVDSTQQLLSPSPCIVGDRGSVVARQSSDGSIGRFPLKPRNFGFTWFLLLFSPDRKAGGLARSKSNKPWAALKPIRRSGSGSSDNTALVVERGRRKTAGCWACVSNTSRLDSFDQR